MTSILETKWTMFIKVAELGSLTRAANAFDIPQSVISRQIGALERECGALLFRRTGRGVVLTDFGMELFPRMQALLAHADMISDEIRTSGGQPLGEVRLGLLPSTVTLCAGLLIRVVAERFPKVRLHLTEGSSIQLEDWLDQGRLDLSMLVREDDAQDADERTLQRMSLSLIGPPGAPLTSEQTVPFERLAGIPLILPGQSHYLRARLDSLAAQRGLKLVVVVEADSIHLQQEIVAAGGGYAIIATPAAIQASLDYSAARIVDPELPRRLVLAATRLRPNTLAVTSVSKVLTEIFDGIGATNASPFQLRELAGH